MTLAALVIVVLAASAGAAFSRHSSTQAVREGGIAAGESRFGAPSILRPARGGGLGLLPGHGMTTVIGRPHFVHVRPDAHPTAQRPEGEGESATEEHEPISPRTPKGPVRLIPHRTVHAVVTKRTASAGAPAAAPSDFVVNTNKDLGCGHAVGYCSLVNEPSVAVHGNSILQTWNWSAARSSDGGANFTYLDPASTFPNSYGGFCCDQLAYYEPTRDLFIWVLQYVQDGTGHNAIRLAVSNGDAQLAAGNFFYWDLKPSDVGPSAYWYDQPKISASSNNLYMEVSRYAIAGNSFGGSVLIRMSLATLAAHGTLTEEAYSPGSAVFSPGPVQGAASTMYFAGHVNTSTLRLYSWPESVGPAGVTSTDIGHSLYPQVFPYTCPRAGGSANADWCPRASGTGGFAHDDRINSGWVQNGTIGFSWDASQGTVAGGIAPTFPYPYVHVVRINEATKTLIDQPVAWAPTYAIQWSALAPNANGDLAGLVEYGGGTTYEHCGALIHDGFATPSIAGFWEFHNIASSTADTAVKKSGDYLTIRQNGNSWSGACYTVTGGGDNGDIHPHYVNFGRAGTPPPPPPPFQPPTRLTATVGPGKAIKVTKGGGKVKAVAAGKFLITVQDKTKKDNFHLTCAGVNKKTKVKSKGTTSWSVTLTKGKCSYRSDAHKKLAGSFKVT